MPFALEQSVSIYAGAHAAQREKLLFIILGDTQEAILKLFYGVSRR